MAHSTDYQSQSDISRLKKSNQPKSQPQNPNDIAHHFLHSHAHWSIDSIVLYLMITYKSEGMTRTIISEEVRKYIDQKI